MKAKDILGVLGGVAFLGTPVVLAWYAKDGAQWARYGFIAYGVFFAAVIVRSIIVSKQRWATGTEVGRFRAQLQGNELVCEGRFHLSDLAGTPFRKPLPWCRIAAQARVLSEEIENDWQRGFWGRCVMAMSEYSLRLWSPNGFVLHSEKNCLQYFFAFLWHKGRGMGYDFFGFEKHRRESWGKFALLEFIPPAPGEYKFDFSVIALDEQSVKGMQSKAEIVELEFFVLQGVRPMTESAYPHKKLDFSKQGIVRTT